MLNLNNRRLVQERLKVITQIVKIINELSHDTEVLSYFADMELGLTGDCLQAFYSARLQQFKNLAPEINYQSLPSK